jgi:hypothetical protein
MEMIKKYKSTGGVYADDYQKRKILQTTVETKHSFFEKNGYLFYPKLIDNIQNYKNPPPVNEKNERIYGVIGWQRKDRVIYLPEESQVPGSLARYNMPLYKELSFIIKKKIEPLLGVNLLPTYFYDRFYYVGQQLKRHCDRHACEISVSLQISTNCKEPWPIWFETPEGSEEYIIMENGDAVIYKGCEREHWRDPLKSKYNIVQKKLRNFKKISDDTYHHQVFFHYVNSQGPYVHYANDSNNIMNTLF